MDSDYVLDVKKDIGLTDSDLAGQYQYTKDIVSVDGSQRGDYMAGNAGSVCIPPQYCKGSAGTETPPRCRAACPTGISSTM